MQNKTKDKKAALFRATLELISEQGFHGTPMSQIAQRANIGVGTIYRYFPSKEDLINALYLDVKVRLIQNTMRNSLEGMPIREAFSLIFRNVVDYFVENPAELLFMEQYANSPLITTATQDSGFQMFKPINQLFDEASKENLLKELPMEVLSSLAYGATLAIAKFCIFGKNKFDNAVLSESINAIWDIIKR